MDAYVEGKTSLILEILGSRSCHAHHAEISHRLCVRVSILGNARGTREATQRRFGEAYPGWCRATSTETVYGTDVQCIEDKMVTIIPWDEEIECIITAIIAITAITGSADGLACFNCQKKAEQDYFICLTDDRLGAPPVDTCDPGRLVGREELYTGEQIEWDSGLSLAASVAQDRLC